MTLRSFSMKQLAYAGLVGAAVVSAAINVPPALASSHGPHDLVTQGYSGSVAGYVLGANNTYSAQTFSAFGVEGIASNDVGGVGTLGYALAAKSYGAYGVTFGTNGIGVYGAGDGPTPGPTSTPDLTSESTGVVGDSHSGFGVYGSTEFPGVADDEANPIGGVVGVDSANAGHYNSGVVGMTTNGAYGVEGVSGDGALGGVFGYGTGTYGDGVDGTSENDLGVYGETFSTSTEPPAAGVEGESGTAQSYGVEGYNDSSGPGVYGYSTTGSAFVGSSNGSATFAGANAKGNGADITGSAIGIVGRAPSGTGSYPLVLTDSSGSDLFFVDGNGDYYYHGSSHTFSRTRSGYTATAYGPKSSEPTIEDTGSGRVVSGLAQVRLDPAVAEQMDMSTNYRVFITPDGDTRGLYVATKTPQGFVVRENQGGRDSVDFDYRIVAIVDGQARQRSAIFARESDAKAALGMPNAPIIAIPHPSLHGRPMSRAMSAKRSLVANTAGAKLRIFVPQKNLAVESRYVPTRLR